ncbi:MAG: fibronectin type III domain-containing protein [Candidatus Heimdallarchaeaceae archaeon]|jgi:3',5'-cyclic AMP phosphodiesterase CpdA
MKSKIPYFLIIIAILMISPLTLLTFEVYADDFNPINIHLSWQHDTSTTMTVAWRTNEITDSIVEYGLDISYTDEASSSNTVKWHFVELTGLEPDTIYHYRVGNGEIWSEDFAFKTGTTGKQTSFVGMGDAQEANPNRKMMVNIVNTIQDIDFVLYSGDFVELARQQDQWYKWFNDYTPLTTHIPFMTALGNHEKNNTNYYEAVAMPGKEEYYSFNYGPVHIPVLHTVWEGFEENYTEQVNWLIDDLTTHQDYDWTVVMMHRPPFSSFPRHFEVESWYKEVNASFVPIFEQFQVDAVLTGHEHAYERLFEDNVTYIISGGAGSWLNSVFPAYTINQSVYAESTFNYIYFNLYENQLDIRAFRPDYSLIDQYTINKQEKPDLRCDNLPLALDVHWKDTQIVNITIANNGDVAITQETQATVEVSDGNSWDLTVPALDVGEKTLFEFEWKPPEKGSFIWTITVDTDSEIDEVVEENNELTFMFNAVKIEGASFFADGPWGIIGVISSILIVAYATLKRKKKLL